MGKISILGASGFIGSHLMKSLSTETDLINAVSRSGVFPATSVKTKHFKLSLETVETWPEEIFDVDTIYYLISSSTPGSGQKDLSGDIALNLQQAVKLFERIRNPHTHVIFASSGGTVYGDEGGKPHSEQDATDPICGYGIVKLALEKYLQMMAREERLKYSILRLANPYGPWNIESATADKNPFGVISVFINNLAKGKPIQLIGSQDSKRDYIYIDDLIEALNKVRKNPLARNQIYNIGTGLGTSLSEIVQNLQSLQKFEPTMLPARAFDVAQNVLDISKIKNELGWSPRTGLSDGISTTFKWRMSLPGG